MGVVESEEVVRSSVRLSDHTRLVEQGDTRGYKSVKLKFIFWVRKFIFWVRKCIFWVRKWTICNPGSF